MERSTGSSSSYVRFDKNGRSIFSATRSGLLSAMTTARLAHGSDLFGSTLTISDLGVSAARLARHFKVRRIVYQAASPAAIKLLSDHEIEVAAAEDRSPSTDVTGASDLIEDWCAKFDDDAELFDELQANLLSNASWFRMPTDNVLTTPTSSRIGTGGGGT